MKRRVPRAAGFTLVELVITLTLFVIIALGFMALFVSLINSTIIAKRQAQALSLATSQMEYLKSLPYDNLAVQGGSIYATTLLPATTTKKLNGVTYTITTSISYVDDAYDGCGSYPTQALKQLYCRNYPPPSGAPSPDQNPADYKIIHVNVTDNTGLHLASVDTEESAHVAETASTTGALFVSVIDDSGTPISNATVTVVDNTVSPAVSVSDSTDTNGVSIFYGLPNDSGTDYIITATKSGYSSLTTINASGSLQPTYPNQKILSQQSSYVTLTIKKQGTYSLVLEATDTSGNPISGMKIYVKGGYKKYTSASDTSYYFDNLSPSDTRPTTDSSGLASLQNLVPGTYVFCGDTASSNCKVGSTTYYLAAAVPYTNDNPLNPVVVPTYDPSDPPATTYTYGGNDYIQKVRLIFTTVSGFPRVYTLSPGSESKTAPDAGSFAFTLSGANLPCTSSPATCGTTVAFVQSSNTFTASCTGSTGLSVNCTVNLTTAATGNTKLVVTANGYTLTLPTPPPIGGIIVNP